MTITVKELIDRLEALPQDAEVADVIDEETLADIFHCSVICTELEDDGK